MSYNLTNSVPKKYNNLILGVITLRTCKEINTLYTKKKILSQARDQQLSRLNTFQMKKNATQQISLKQYPD